MVTGSNAFPIAAVERRKARFASSVFVGGTDSK